VLHRRDVVADLAEVIALTLGGRAPRLIDEELRQRGHGAFDARREHSLLAQVGVDEELRVGQSPAETG